MAQLFNVSLMSNRQRNSIEEGTEDPTLVMNEKGSSNSFVIDSKDRITGNLSEYIVDMGYQMMKGRYIQLKRVIVPKIPNVTQFNNTIRMRSEDGGGIVTADITIPIGLYNTTTLANELVNQINAGFVLAGIVDTVTVSFNTLNRTFTLSSVNGINLSFDETCSFIRYGKDLAPFESASTAVPATSTTLYSSTAGMIYTRYITVSSDALTKFSYGNSLMSSAQQPPSIVGVIDLIDLYTPEDWDVSAVYNGIYRAIDVINSPRLRIVNPSRSIPNQIDINVKDQWGKDLNSVVQLGSPYPNDNSSITLMFEIFY